MPTLNDAAKFLSGGTPRKANPLYWGGATSWYSASNMDKKFLNGAEPKVTELGLSNGTRIAPKGATLLLVRGSGLFNHVPICFADEDVAFNQDVKAIIAKSHVDPTFLHFWIESLRPTLNGQIGVTGIGAGKFDTDFLKSLPFPDFSKSKQAEIAYYASSFDRKIELNRQMNATLEAMVQAIFKDWFVDFGPTRRKVDGETDSVKILGGLIPETAKAKEIAALFPDGLTDEGLPEEWEHGTLDAYADLNPESWKKSNHPDSVKYLDLKNTKWGNIEEFTPYVWSDAPSRARRVARPNDTLVGTVRPGNGSYTFISGDGYTASTGFAVLRPKDKIFTNFIYVAATRSESIEDLAHLADGGAYPAVRSDVVLATKIVKADAKVLEAFENIASPLRQRIEQAKQENQTLAETRDYLLPKLMSGEVRLGDAA